MPVTVHNTGNKTPDAAVEGKWHMGSTDALKNCGYVKVIPFFEYLYKQPQGQQASDIERTGKVLCFFFLRTWPLPPNWAPEPENRS